MRILLALVAVFAAGAAHAVYFTSAPGSAASGQAYWIAAAESSGDWTEVYVLKNGGFFAWASGWGYAEAGESSTDFGAQTINYEVYSTTEWGGDYAQHPVTISNPNTPPSITWSIATPSAYVNQWYQIEAHGSDPDGNLSNVWVDRDWVPHAYGLGGDGYNSWVGNPAVDSSAGPRTYQARSWDLTDAMSNIIQHTVSIVPNNAPTATWVQAPNSAWANQVFNVQARGNDADGNLSWVRVWKDGQVFAWHGGGNGSESYTSANSASRDRSGTIRFTLLAGDALGAESPLLIRDVPIYNRPPHNPQLTGHALEVWTDDGTRNWVDLSAHVEDLDSNLSEHTIWFIRGGWGVGPLEALNTGNTTNLTPPNSQFSAPGNSNKTGRFYPNSPGRLDFHTNGKDLDGQWSSGASITVYVYSPNKNAEFVSQSFNDVPVTTSNLSLNNRDVVQVKVKMRNIGDWPWSAGGYPFKLKSIGANWGVDTVSLPAGVTINPSFAAAPTEHEFVFNITAPDSVGDLIFQWRMRQDLPQPLLFGQASASITIKVNDVLPPSTPSNIRAVSSGGSTLSVIWDASNDNGPADAIRYRVELFRGPDAIGLPQMTASADPAWNFTGLRSDTEYRVKITAIDGAQKMSAPVEATFRTSWNPTGDDDNDGVSNQIERDLGLDWGDPADVRVYRYTYDKANQLKTGPGGEYVKDAEGNIKKLQ